MAITLGTIKGKVLIQLADKEPVEVGTIEIPITGTRANGGATFHAALGHHHDASALIPSDLKDAFTPNSRTASGD